MSQAGDNTLILDTTQGKVVIEMRPDLAPGHVARIKELVRDGFYDGVVFHRVIEGFMAQTGCPEGTRSRRPRKNAQGRVQPRAACARHRLDGARPEPGLRRQPVLHLLRPCPLPRRPVYAVVA